MVLLMAVTLLRLIGCTSTLSLGEPACASTPVGAHLGRTQGARARVTEAGPLRSHGMNNIIKRALVATTLVGAAAAVGAAPAAADPIGGLPIGGVSNASVDGLGLVGGVADSVGRPGGVLDKAGSGSVINGLNR
jgi:hypothetical protein